ncbi:MAG: response regulator transcription factor [Christensenellales bacterium]
MLIYIVEDDANIRQMESYALKNSGFDVMEFDDAPSFYAALERQLPALVVLDIMLPGEDGMSILKRLRSDGRTREIPVMMVTARTTEMDMVRGLDAGADDYIAKPFGIMAFLSRTRALLRRSAKENQSQITSGEITIDDEKRQVICAGRPVEITFKEYELLKYLMINEGIALSRDKIMDRVWGEDYSGESRTVDMHIKTLRQKLGEPGAIIKTIRNVGYKIDP